MLEIYRPVGAPFSVDNHRGAKMKTRTLSIVFMTLCIFLTLPAYVLAKGKPEITKHEAQYLQNAINIHIQWQSPNPVTLVKISVANQQSELKVDEYDNKRNREGYSGEVSVALKLDSDPPLPILYIIQLEDELRIKSDPITGKVRGGRLQQTDLQGPSEESLPQTAVPSLNRMQSSPRSEPSQTKPGDIVGEVIAAVERYDRAPTLEELRVNRLDANTISIATKAEDDKGLREINFSIFDTSGNKMDVQTLTNLGRIWQGTSKTFKLPPGSYSIVGQAVDTAGNTSQERRADLIIEGSGAVSPASGRGGSLTVTISPLPASNAGGLWRVDNGPWQKSGETITNLAPGIHIVEYAEISDWVRPENEKVVVEGARDISLEGVYKQ